MRRRLQRVEAQEFTGRYGGGLGLDSPVLLEDADNTVVLGRGAQLASKSSGFEGGGAGAYGGSSEGRGRSNHACEKTPA
jgi:hypothetical protein